LFLYQPPELDRKVKIMRGRAGHGRFEDTIKHLGEDWIPANPTTLHQVQDQLHGHLDPKIRQEIIEKVKSDPGLFLYCARNIKHLVEDFGAGINPIEALRSLEEEKLQKMFAVTDREISGHRLKEMTRYQALRLQHTLISSQTAEAIAPKASLSPDLACAASMFRQLGLDLIAWNYPSIYSRAITAHRVRGTDLDAELDKLLGISPLQIGRLFANEWGMSADLKRALSPEVTTNVGDASAAETGSHSHPMGLAEICQISELFAKAKDPFHYPEVKEEWKAKESAINQRIGLETLKKIEIKVEKIVSNYKEAREVIEKLPLVEAHHAIKPATTHGQHLMLENRYLQKCPAHICQGFSYVYEQLTEAKISLDAIRTLVDYVVPIVGFERGCLYLFDPKTTRLTPALRIGDQPLDSYLVLLKHVDSEIEQRVFGTISIRRQGRGITGEAVDYICGPIDNPNYPGVLYLELREDKTFSEGDAIALFDATRKTLGHCLGAKIAH
jgi:hypothetical protein